VSAGSDLLDLAELAGGHGRGRGYALVYVTYLDDSDADGSRVQTLAGYVAPLEAWRRFELLANAVCDSFNVSIIHAKDFEGTKGDFKGWSLKKKRDFIDLIYTAAEYNIPFGISRSILKDEYRKRQAELGLNKSASAYGVAFSSIIFTVIRDNTLSPQILQEGMSFIVESGHNNNEELQNHFHLVKDHEIFVGALRSLTFADKKSSRAIQLADFFAFYSRRAASKSEKVGAPVPLETHYKRFFHRVPHFQHTIHDAYKDGREAVKDWKTIIPDWGDA
jgi:hypothetical protein